MGINKIRIVTHLDYTKEKHDYLLTKINSIKI